MLAKVSGAPAKKGRKMNHRSKAAPTAQVKASEPPTARLPWLLGLATLLFSSLALAQPVIIDNWSVDSDAASNTAGVVNNVATTDPAFVTGSMLGASRIIMGRQDAGTGIHRVTVNSGVVDHNSGTQNRGTSWLIWDGRVNETQNGNLSATNPNDLAHQLNSDLTLNCPSAAQGLSFIVVPDNSQNIPIRIDLFSSAANTSTLLRTVTSDPATNPTAVFFPFADFATTAGSGANPANLSAIRIRIESPANQGQLSIVSALANCGFDFGDAPDQRPIPAGLNLVNTIAYISNVDFHYPTLTNPVALSQPGLAAGWEPFNLAGASHRIGGPWMPRCTDGPGGAREVCPANEILLVNDTDAEVDGQPGVPATGDDIAGTDDERGLQEVSNFDDYLGIPRDEPREVICDGRLLVSSPPPSTPDDMVFCAVVRVANPSFEDPAVVAGWIDFDRDGGFGNDCADGSGAVTPGGEEDGNGFPIGGGCERSAATVLLGDTGLITLDPGGPVCDAGAALMSDDNFGTGNIPPNCAGAVILVWDVSSDQLELTTQATYLRLRITEDPAFFANPRPDGVFETGEIEDHILDPGTIPVSIHAFESSFTDQGLVISWSTASETHNMGFYIWGETERGGFSLLTPEMIPSTASDVVEPQTYTITLPRLTERDVRDLVVTAVDYFGDEEMFGYFRVGEAFGELNAPDLIDWAAIRAEIDQRLAESGKAERAGLWRAPSLGRGEQAVAADFLVTDLGMQRISYEDLLAAGLDLNGANPFQIAVTVNGSGVPRVIEASSGNALSADMSNTRPRPANFGPGSSILFWGERPQLPDSKYVDHLVYRIELNAAEAVEMQAHQAKATAPSSLATRYLRRADDLAYNFSNPSDDPWFMAELRSWQSNRNRFNANFPVAGEIDGSKPARVEAELAGLTVHPRGVSHRVRILVNGTEVGEHAFQGQTVERLAFDFPASLLNQGGNVVQVHSLGFDGINSITLVESVELSWASPVRANGSQLLVRPRLDDGHDGLLIRDLPAVNALNAFARSGSEVFRLAPEAVSRNVVSLALPTAAVDEVWVSANGDFRSPQALGAVPAQQLTDGLGNLVVVAHPAFMPSHSRETHPLNQFVAHRQAQGWSVSLLSISDIQLHFGGGMALPQALTRFLQAAAAASPRGAAPHVLLVGSDSYDYRDILGHGSLSFVPTVYASTQFVRHTPSDALLADLSGDGLADLPLGRWPVRTQGDLQASVDKVLDWEFNVAGLGSAVWLTDVADPNLASFSSQVDRLSNLLVDAGWLESSVQQILFEEAGSAVAARNELFSALEQGRTLTGFSGHGSPTFWSFQGILRPGDIADLNNHGWPTLVGTMACYTTYFVSPFSNTLAHRLMNGLSVDASGAASPARNGAVAVHGAATLSNMAQNEIFVREVLAAQLQGYTLGESVQAARTTAAQRGIRDLVINWTLLGDPSLRLQHEAQQRGRR